MSTVEQKVDKILKALEVLDELKAFNQKTDARFDTLEGSVANLTVDVTVIKDTLDRHGVAIIGMQEGITELNTRVGGLEIKQDLTFNRLDSLSKKMDSRNAEVSANHGNYIHLEERMTNVEHIVFGTK